MSLTHHRHGINPNGVVPVMIDCKLELRADPVRSGNEDGRFHVQAGQVESRTEAAEPADDLLPHRAFDMGFDLVDCLVSGRDVHACISILF